MPPVHKDEGRKVYVGPQGQPRSGNPNNLGDYQISTRLAGLPSGRDGVIATLKHMRDFARASVTNTEQVARRVANEVFKLKGVPPRKWLREISALHAFVRDTVRYVKDPVGVELVQTPEATLKLGYGDCDDKSTLLAALLLATGHPCRFVAVGFRGNPFSHVLVEAKSGDRWIPAETIIQKPLGWFPPEVTSKYYLKV